MSTRVLLGDADPFHLRLLEEMCAGAGHVVLAASDGPGVLDLAVRERPDVILMDAALPRLDGFEVLRILERDDALRTIPVLLVLDEQDLDGRARAIEMGAEDYVGKPYRVFEVRQRLRNALRVARAAHAAPSPAPEPGLHATPNMRTPIALTLEYELVRARQNGVPLSVVRIVPSLPDGIDPELESSQRSLVESVVRSSLRSADPVFRLPRGELAVLLPDTDSEEAELLRRRLAQRLADRTLRLGSPGTPAMLLGVATAVPGHATTWQALLDSAAPRPRSGPPPA